MIYPLHIQFKNIECFTRFINISCWMSVGCHNVEDFHNRCVLSLVRSLLLNIIFFFGSSYDSWQILKNWFRDFCQLFLVFSFLCATKYAYGFSGDSRFFCSVLCIHCGSSVELMYRLANSLKFKFNLGDVRLFLRMTGAKLWCQF